MGFQVEQQRCRVGKGEDFWNGNTTSGSGLLDLAHVAFGAIPLGFPPRCHLF